METEIVHTEKRGRLEMAISREGCQYRWFIWNPSREGVMEFGLAKTEKEARGQAVEAMEAYGKMGGIEPSSHRRSLTEIKALRDAFRESVRQKLNPSPLRGPYEGISAEAAAVLDYIGGHETEKDRFTELWFQDMPGTKDSYLWGRRAGREAEPIVTEKGFLTFWKTVKRLLGLESKGGMAESEQAEADRLLVERIRRR